MRLRFAGLRALVAVCVLAAMVGSAARPALAAGGSDPPLFTDSLLSVDAAGSFIQGRPFEVLVTGSNEAPPGQTNLLEYDLYVFLLAAKVGTCPMTEQGMALYVKRYPKDTQIVFKTPVPEAGAGPGLYGPFTIPLFEASADNFTGPLYICAYSDWATEDAAWASFGPVTVTPAIPASQFRSRMVRLGATRGCWPLAQTEKEQAQGLTAVSHPARPMLFTFKKAGSQRFSTLGVPVPLNGVWIGRGDKVIGRWHGAANSDTTHKSPASVTAVVLYPAGQRVPANGARLQLGASCSSHASL